MIIRTTIKWAAAVAAVCLAVHSASGQNQIGVNFVADDNLIGGEQPPGGVQNGWVDSLLPTNIAGVFPQANWNNVGRFGDNITLNDNNGTSSGVSIAWTAPGMWHCNGQPGFPPIINNPNAKLMDGFLESTWAFSGLNGPIAPGTAVTNIANCAPIIFLSGLQQFVANQCGGPYSIVIYCNSDFPDCRHGEYWIDAVTGPSSAIVVGPPITPPIFVTHCTQFDGTFTQVSPFATNDAAAFNGNYIVFSGLTNDEILIVSQNISPSPAAVINGIQVIALGAHLPPTLALPTISPTNVIFLGSTVTISEFVSVCGTPSYQWQTDGGGSLTNIPDATNSSLVTTPTTAGIWNYGVIVTNVYGCVTSPVVALTVLPASVPIVTQDTGTADFGPVTNLFAFIGGSVNFYTDFGLGTLPLTNQWLVKLDSGGGYAPVVGLGNNPWTCTNVQSSSAGNYELAATNAVGRSNSTPAHLTALADLPPPPSNGVTNMYSYCIYTNHPWAYWKFEETNDTLNSSMQAYDYSGHNFDATYGNSDGTSGSGCLDGGETTNADWQFGPGHGDFLSGFPYNNGCATMANGANNGYLTVPPLNLNTNRVTFTMWIYINPANNVISPYTGLLMNRNGTDAAGIGFGGNVTTNDWDVIGVSIPELGYTWNQNSASTYNWHSHLYPAVGTWNFVACTITPSSTTMYLYFIGWDEYFNPVTNMLKAINLVTNGAEAFSGGTTWIGSDNRDNTRTFDGYIDEVAVFTNALRETQIQDLFLKALGMPHGFPPPLPPPPGQPADTTIFSGQTLQLTFDVHSIPAPNFQWYYLPPGGWQPLGIAPGRTTTNSTLYWTNYTGPYTNFRCIATNFYGGVTSRIATVTLIPVPNWNKGLWTLNFAVTPPNNTPYYGRGVLGTNYYWNALSGGQFNNTPPSLWDDGATVSGIHFGSTNFGLASASAGANNVLLDNFCSFVNSGTAFVFTGVPNGEYNLALYGMDAAYPSHGTIFTVNGASQSATDAQDAVLLPDNTVFYTNLVVKNGTLEVDMMPLPAGIPYLGAFNGAQLELIAYAPNISLANNGTNLVLTWVDGIVLQSTNVTGPWTTNTTASAGSITINPTGSMKFYRIWTARPPF
jgi:hypothetical protein